MTVKIDTDAEINSVRLKNQSNAPTGTASGYINFFSKSDGLYFVQTGGVVIGPLLTGTFSSELDYVERNTQLSVTATGSPDIFITGNALNYDGNTAVIINLYAPNARPTTSAGADLRIWLFEDGVDLGRIAYVSNPAAGVMNMPINLFRRHTPVSGSHTYSIRASVSSGTGLVGGGSGSVGISLPAYLRITKANP